MRREEGREERSEEMWKRDEMCSIDFCALFSYARFHMRASYFSLSLFYPAGKTMSAHIAMQVSGATTTASGNGPSYDVW